MEEFWISLRFVEVWYFWRIIIYNPAIGFYLVEGDFEDVGKICGVLRLAVDLRFWSVRLGWARSIFNYACFVGVLFKVLFIWNRTWGGSSGRDLRPTSDLGLTCEWTFVLNIVFEMLYRFEWFFRSWIFPEIENFGDYLLYENNMYMIKC